VKQECPIDPKDTEDKTPGSKADGLTKLPPADAPADDPDVAPQPQRSTI